MPHAIGYMAIAFSLHQLLVLVYALNEYSDKKTMKGKKGDEILPFIIMKLVIILGAGGLAFWLLYNPDVTPQVPYTSNY